ncbi:MAG: prefoldin subunit alpha [Candidatus Micrarchaeales archaeon]|jgi:prefoldin alpha subunit
MDGDENSIEEKEGRLLYLQNLYGQQYEALMNDLTTFALAQAAIERNLHLLERKDQLKGSNILVNAEGGIYIEAKVKEIGKVMAYVGAGYLIEKNVEQAKSFMNDSVSKSKNEINRLDEEKLKLENELMKIQYEIESIRQNKAE